MRPRWCVADQLHAKADVIREMERVQLCQDPQSEFAVIREGLGVSRANRIFRVHGHMIARNFDVELGSLERLFSRVHGGQSGASHAECSPVRNRV